MRPSFNTLHFETTDGFGDDYLGAPDPDGAAPEPAAPAAPDFSDAFQSPAFGEAVGQAVMQTLSQLAAAGPEDGGVPNDDDFFGTDPAEFRQNLHAMIRQEIQGAMQPILPDVEAMRTASWQDRIDRFTGELDTIKQIGEFLPENLPVEQAPAALVERVAIAFLPEMESLYGQGTERSLEAALRAAADYTLPIFKAAHDHGYSSKLGVGERISGAPAPAPVQGGEAQILDEPGDEFEALERYAARNGLR